MDSNKAIKKIVDEMLEYFGLEERAGKPLHVFAGRLLAVGYDIGRSTKTRSKPVLCYDDNDKIIKTYISMAEAAKDMGLANYSSISNAIKRKGKSCGYRWRLVNPNDHYTYRQIK